MLIFTVKSAKLIKLSLLVSLLYWLVDYCKSQEAPFVETPQGSIQGFYAKSYGGRIISAFEGIPYAKPPINELRFAEPEPYGKFNGTWMANKNYHCIFKISIWSFKGIFGTEDCLYVYVYVPLKEINGDENLNVVAHIHGGGFQFGSPSFLSGPNYLMDKDIVFVSFNYRLGILGFLSTEDNVVSGNNGLKDQTMALRWIQENIKSFGGNPNSVTITGLSAGGASVHYHYLSPLSKGLFHRGLSQSGTALSSWALIENPLKKAKQVAAALNCTTDDTKIMVECFRNVNSKELLTATSKLHLYLDSIPFINFGPVIEKGDNPFVDEHPYKLLKQGKVYDVPWITSNVKDEGIFPTTLFMASHVMSEFDKNWNDMMYYILDLYDTVDEADKLKVVKAIRKFYYEDEKVSEENVYSMVKMFSDRCFFISGEMAVRLQSQVNKSPVYYYFFTYLAANSLLPTPGMKRGVCHGDDGAQYIKMFNSPPELDPVDEKMMNLFTEFIAVYANLSIPSINDVKWSPVESGNKYINVLEVESPNEIKMIKMVHVGSYEFWNSLPIKENDKLFPELA